MFRRWKEIYRKLDSAASLVVGLEQHDEQIANLNAAIMALMIDPELGPKRRESAKKKLETLLLYQAQGREDAERLRELYESAAARVAAAEMEIAELRKRLNALEAAMTVKSGREQP